MKVIFSEKKDFAYIALDVSGDDIVAKTRPCKVNGMKGEVNLDFNKNDFLLGIRIIGASKILPKALLEKAERAQDAMLI